jgi:hypothetical protein
MCVVKMSCVLLLTQKYQAVNKEEIRLTNGGQGCIKYPFLLTRGKSFARAAGNGACTMGVVAGWVL